MTHIRHYSGLNHSSLPSNEERRVAPGEWRALGLRATLSHKGRYIHSRGTYGIKAKDISIRERAPSFANLSCRHDWSSKSIHIHMRFYRSQVRRRFILLSSLSLLTTGSLDFSYLLLYPGFSIILDVESSQPQSHIWRSQPSISQIRQAGTAP